MSQDKDKLHEDLFLLITKDEARYQGWRRYQTQNRGRLPAFNGSKIRDKSIALMLEYLSLIGVE